MGSMIAHAFLVLIIADVLWGALVETATWFMWRSEVRFKRQFSVSSPPGYFEFRDWLWPRRGRSSWAA